MAGYFPVTHARAGRTTQVVSHTTTTSQGNLQDTEERRYGRLGEVVYEKKTVVPDMSPDCVYKWPAENQSIKECFSGCYGSIFVALPPFVRLQSGKSLATLWDVTTIASCGELLKWSEVVRLASMRCISDLNNAMLYAYEFGHIGAYAKDYEVLKRYCEGRNVVWPDEGRLNPYTLSSVTRALRRHSYANLVLDFHGITEVVPIKENISPDHFPSMEKFHPMHVYTENQSVLLTSYHEFNYCLLAADNEALLRDIVDSEKLEGFFADQGETSNWFVPDEKILNKA